MNRKRKIFHDSVHGNISVPEEYCKGIIDTSHFQRLRRIEQTSMRSLFPSARHDRFIHSLGTFHLGSKLFGYIKRNSQAELIEKINENNWDVLQKTYELACLLHDCGHSPFSHTFEKYYDKPSNLLDKLIEAANDSEFEKDARLQSDSAEHERVSSIIVLKIFRSRIEELQADSLLIARMICGYLYVNTKNVYEELSNCFIQLLHGELIDVDGLDYVTRDKWASGFTTGSVNLERLLTSACIKTHNGKLTVCYNKNALSELQSVIDIKNFQQLWVFSHHKVKYDQYILDKAIEQLALFLMDNTSKEDALSRLFNVESFFKPIEFDKSRTIYLPTDDDLVHYLKISMNNNTHAVEWLARDHKYKPVWKTFAEFNSFFSYIQDQKELAEFGLVDTHSETIIEDFLKENGFEVSSYVKIKVKPKIKSIHQGNINIAVKDNVMDYHDFKLPHQPDNKIRFFFYIYIPEGLIPKSNELINRLKTIKSAPKT
jgi:hypothetical protein